jgi:hypothetical protein
VDNTQTMRSEGVCLAAFSMVTKQKRQI